MRKLPAQVSLLVAILLLLGSQVMARAQEALSTTNSSGGTTSSTATTSDASAAATTSPQGAATSGTGAPSVQGSASGAGVFSRSPLRIIADVTGGYDDNVNTVPSHEQGSAFTGGNLTLSYNSESPRLYLTLNAGAGGRYYYARLSSQNYDIDLQGAMTVTYRATPRLTLGATVIAAYLTEPSFTYAGGTNYRNGNYLYTTDKLFLAYVWAPRLSTKTSYTFAATNYENASVAMFSNYISNIFGNELRFLLAPTTTLVGEYRFEVVSYEDAPLNSTTHFLLAGLDHRFNPHLTGILRGGAEFRSYQDEGNRNGPFFEGNLNYALGSRTSVSWINRYGLEEPYVSGAQSATVFRTGLLGKFNMTPRIGWTAEVTYAHIDYNSLTSGVTSSPPSSENAIDAGIDVRYRITPLLGVQAGYHYTKVDSGNVSQDYSRNRVFAGLNVAF